MPQKTQPRAVFLIGFMGAGKTSVGRALAHRLNWNFVDLDDRIEAREQRSIAEIFLGSGEEAFRHVETAALADLLAELQKGPPTVVALGGGAPVRQENAAMLAGFGAPQVFLDAPFEILCRRCGGSRVRPLFRNEREARQLYETRRPVYLRAHLRLDTGSCSVHEAAAKIAEALAKNQGE